MLNNLKKIEGATKNTKRIGRGQGSGQGTQAGKGHKGQKARKSGHVRTGFIGGTMPLYMRLPKVGFKNAENKTHIHSISLSRLEKLGNLSEVVTKEYLVTAGLIKGLNKGKLIKFIDSELYSKNFSFKAEDFLFSAGAKTKIEKNSGKIK